MKKSSKKIPKSHLPKFEGGGSNFNEFGFNVEGQGQGSSTQNMYNDKRSAGKNIGQYAGYAQATMNTAGALSDINNQGYDGNTKNYAQSQAVGSGITQGIGTINPLIAMGTGIRKSATGIIGDEQGSARTASNWMAAPHESAMSDISAANNSENTQSQKAGGYLSAIGDITGMSKMRQMFSYGTGNDEKTTGFWGKYNDLTGITARNNQKNSLEQNQFAFGGMNMQPNAEIESEENVVAPNGGFLQANGPTHENGGVPVALPGNSMVFSDRLKLGKKTFAELNKVNNTNKEDKILESNKFGNTSKRTAELMKFAKNKNSEELFNTQEALKQAKVEAYAKRMGVKLPSTDIRKEARDSGNSFKYGGTQLPKFLTGGRYVDGVWVEDNQPMQGFQADTWQQSSGPVNNVGNTTSNGTMITNEDFNKFKDSSHAASNNQIINQGNKREVQLGIDIQRLAAQEMSGDANTISNKQYNPRVTDPNFNKFDWSSLKTTGQDYGNFALQNAGNIYDLTRKQDPLQKYDRAKATLLDPSAAMRDATEQTRRAEYNVRGASGGNAGTYLANRVGLNAQNIMTKDRIRQQYANANAGITNQTNQFNTEIAYREAEAQAKDRAMRQNVNSQAIHNMASNFGKFSKSGKQDNMDQDELSMFQWRYKNEPGFREQIDKFSTSKKSKRSNS